MRVGDGTYPKCMPLLFAKMPHNMPRLGILIFGSNFWDPHQKWNSDSIFDSEDSDLDFFFQILLLKNQEIGIPIPKFGILKKINVGIEYTSSHIGCRS
jgi:hypothetical protein